MIMIIDETFDFSHNLPWKRNHDPSSSERNIYNLFHQTTVKETPSFDRFRGVFTGEELTVHYFFFKTFAIYKYNNYFCNQITVL